MTTGAISSTDVLVLHTLRCIGYSNLERVASASGLEAPDTESELIDLAVAGFVKHVPGDFGGWSITEAGRKADATWMAAELEATGARRDIAEAYDRFLVLNPELLDLCGAWQIRTIDGVATANDHTDPAYDARVLDWLSDLDQRVGFICADLAMTLRRFDRHRARLTHALTRALTGDLDYVTDRTDSYHTAWFHLHEDLLATLGIPR